MEKQRVKKNTGLPTPLYFFVKEIISIGYRNNLFGLLQLVLIQNIATTSLISRLWGLLFQEVFLVIWLERMVVHIIIWFSVSIKQTIYSEFLITMGLKKHTQQFLHFRILVPFFGKDEVIFQSLWQHTLLNKHQEISQCFKKHFTLSLSPQTTPPRVMQ